MTTKKAINKAHASGNAERGCPKIPTLALLVRFFRKLRCIKLVAGVHCTCMNGDKTKRVCKDPSRWRSVVSIYFHGKC